MSKGVGHLGLHAPFHFISSLFSSNRLRTLLLTIHCLLERLHVTLNSIRIYLSPIHPIPTLHSHLFPRIKWIRHERNTLPVQQRNVHKRKNSYVPEVTILTTQLSQRRKVYSSSSHSTHPSSQVYSIQFHSSYDHRHSTPYIREKGISNSPNRQVTNQSTPTLQHNVMTIRKGIRIEEERLKLRKISLQTSHSSHLVYTQKENSRRQNVQSKVFVDWEDWRLPIGHNH